MQTADGGTGVWLIGARGSVATTAIIGAAALRAGLAAPTGCVSELPDFAGHGLPALADLVFGGHDITEDHLSKRVEQLVHAGVVPEKLPGLVRDDIAAADAEIRLGTSVPGDTRTQAELAAGLAADIRSFRDRHRLARVVVINVASTEPPGVEHPAQASADRLDAALAAGHPVLAPSSLYAYAALRAGCGYVDFTPSTGARLPALDELARARGLPYAGSDAKTGETLVKSALAALFTHRALRVRSWSGTNLLGGGDGATLADPDAARSKNRSKQLVLDQSLGYPVEGEVHIDYVADLGDWKTAWDHISFQGFLGVRMFMQFTWQGCDSALAAPLVIDLARFMAKAHMAGWGGAVPALAFFFKDPVGASDPRLVAQYEALRDWSTAL
jgi:myo-inositol-1-phosphate synthase